MARTPRSEVFSPDEIAVAHVMNRVVRRCFLLGDDPHSGKNYDHRKAWIEELIERFAAFFGIDLITFLNPIRAALAERLEDSDFTAIQRRIEALLAGQENAGGLASRADRFLSPLSIDEAHDPLGPVPSGGGFRCSDKGFLPMSLTDYLQLLDWTARQWAHGKRGVTPEEAPPILQRLGLAPQAWCELAGNFGQLFHNVAGRPAVIDQARSLKTCRRYHLSRQVRTLLEAA